MEEDGKVFSDYDVDLISGRTMFEGVKLIGGKNEDKLDGNVFKIMLLNNNLYFMRASGEELRAYSYETGGAKYKFIATEEQDTYYLQSMDDPDRYVSFKAGGWYLKIKSDGQDGYNKLAIRFTYDAVTDSYKMEDA